MKIVVAYKWTCNPQDATVSSDGTIDWSRAKPAISEYDPDAIELARTLADETDAQLIGLTVGPSEVASTMARKAVLARGLDSLVVVADDTLRDQGSTEVAGVIAAAVRHIGDVDVLITGDASVDVGGRVVPALVGGFLGWPVLAEVESVAMEADLLRIQRTVPAGRQTLTARGPAVLAIAPGAAIPRVPGMKEILAGGRKPTEVVELAALESPTTTPAPFTVRSTAKPDGTGRKVRMIAESDPTAAAIELVAALRSGGAL